MNRTKKFIYSTIASALQQTVIMISGFIIPRVILEHYGSVINGLTSSITQFMNYFILVEAGLGAAAVYSLYKPLAEKNYKAISAIVNAAKKFYIKSGYVFIGLIFLLALAFSFFSNIKALTKNEVGLLVLVMGASGALDFFAVSKYNVILAADQRSYVVSWASMIATVINTAIIYLCKKTF